MDKMKPSQAKTKLKRILNEVGFSLDHPNPALAWEGFKQFSREEVTCANDGFLFEAGCYDFPGELLFYLDFTRQFTIEDETGEYDHMEQVRITFSRQPTLELETLEASMWADDFIDLPAFFAAVEGTRAFQVAITYPDWQCEIYRGDV